MKQLETRSGNQKIAVISGASSGIGFACARILSTRGFQIIGLARDEMKLKSAMASLSNPGIGFAVDVTDHIATQLLIDKICQDNGRIDWLILCAGIVEPGLFLDQTLDDHRRQMETNYFGSVNLAYPVARFMAGRDGGMITFVSSAAAFVGIAGYGSYAPSKFAIRGLAEIMQIELAAKRILVSVACPPDTDTPQLAYEASRRPSVTKKLAARASILSAEHVAKSIIDQAEAGRFMLTPTWLTTLYALIYSLYAPLFRRQQARMMQSNES